MRHASNRERIARAAAEAAAAAAEKAAKKAAKPRPSRVATPTRMKVVWEVCTSSGKVVKTYGYAEKEAAEVARAKLTASTGVSHMLRGTKVPME